MYYFGIEESKAVMKSEFEMTDLGLMKFFLAIEVQQSESEVLKIFNISNCKTSPTPVIMGLKLSKDDEGSTVDPTMFKRLVGSLM